LARTKDVPELPPEPPEPPPLSKFEWEKLIRDLPSDSPLFGHGLCVNGRCQRKDGTHLAPSTIAHVAITLSTFANKNGATAHPGIDRLALGTKRNRVTVMACLEHLETVGLITATVRGGAPGVRRHYATEYQLSVADAGDPPPAPAPPRRTAPAAPAVPAPSWFHPHHAAGSREPGPRHAGRAPPRPP
jgi:hypothetical protein